MKLFIPLVVFLLGFSTSLGSASANSKSPSATVEAEWSGGGWKIQRDVGDEVSATLSVMSGERSQTVQGVQQTLAEKSVWVFWLAASKPTDEKTIVLEFTLFFLGTAEETEKLKTFARAVSTAVFESYADTNRIPNLSEAQKARQGTILAGAKIDELIEASEIAKLTISGVSAYQHILEQLGMRQSETGEWELTQEGFVTLREFLDFERAEWFESALTARPPKHPCLKGSEDPEEQLLRCTQAFIAEGTKLQSALSGATHPQLDLILNNSSLKTNDPGALATSLIRVPEPSEDSPSAALRAPYDKLVPAVANELATLATLSPLPRESLEALDATWWIARRASAEAYLAVQDAKWEEKFVGDLDLQRVEVDQRTTDNAELEVSPGNPRFFFSTGLVTTFLDDSVKMGMPIMASICLTPAGCVTNGTYNGTGFWSNLGQHSSLDIAINAVTFGKEEPRFSSPNFLIGAGFSPIFATHVSVGASLFENAQTHRVNAAPYISLTLDLVDGKAILGGLGVSNPQVTPITTSSAQGASP